MLIIAKLYLHEHLRPETAVVMHLWPDTVEETHDIAVSTLQCGDVIKIIRGARAPADSILIQGAAAFDESMLTGESMPVNKVTKLLMVILLRRFLILYMYL